jgi:hypothetical protein
MAKSTLANDTRRWTGIAATAASMSVVGLPTEFTVEVKDLSVKYNTAEGTSASGAQATAINWAPVIEGTTSPLEALLSGTLLVVSGVVRLNLGGYVLAGGSFVLNRGTATIGGASADLLTIDLTGVNLFVGVGAGFSGDTTALVTGNATGFLTTSANLSVADWKMFARWPDWTHFIVGSDGVRKYRVAAAGGIVEESV